MRRSRSGNNEGFLSFCNDDMEWIFVGDKTLNRKEAVRQWMATTYIEPPKFMVANLIAEGDFVTALGDITMKDEDGKVAHSRTAMSGAFAMVRWSN
ncbi:nuclear transport factor 2 family protein [Phormidesmis sp. 146-12]